MIDADTRRGNAQIVLDVLAAKGGDGRFLRAIAGRESGLNHAIRHLLAPDANGSIKAWRRNARLFAGNPWYDDLSLWDHGKGLFAMMPAYHLQRWDPLAHPDVLFNPYVASVAAARLTASAMRNGAEVWADVDQAWATGSPRRTASWGPRRERMQKRLRSLGYPADLTDVRPEPGEWGLGPQPDQLDVLWWVAGDAVDDFDHGVDDDFEADIEEHDEDFDDDEIIDDIERPRPARRRRPAFAQTVESDDDDDDDRPSRTPLLVGAAAAAATAGIGLSFLALR